MNSVADLSFEHNPSLKKIPLSNKGFIVRAKALEYYKAGWNIVPVIDWDNLKRPDLTTWAEFKERRATADEFSQWLETKPFNRLGVISGRESGFYVLDVDVPDIEDGIFPELEPFREYLLSCPRERTPGGGWHIFVGIPENIAGVEFVAPHLDYRFPSGAKGELRTQGDMTVIAPSPGYETKRPFDLSVPIPALPFGLFPLLWKNSKQGIRGADAGEQIAAAPVRRTKTIKREPSRATVGDWYDETLRDPATALAVMRSVCVNVGDIDKHFISPLRPERKASALLQVMDDGVICFTDYGVGADPVMLPDVWCAIKTGRPLRTLGKGERILWWLRALKAAGLLTTPTRLHAKLPTLSMSAPSRVVKTYSGIIEALEYRAIYDGSKFNTEAMPMSHRFIADWCGLKSNGCAAFALKWLSDRKYIKLKQPGAWSKKGGTAARYFLGSGPDWLKDIIEGDRADAEEGKLKAGRL